MKNCMLLHPQQATNKNHAENTFQLRKQKKKIMEKLFLKNS